MLMKIRISVHNHKNVLSTDYLFYSILRADCFKIIIIIGLSTRAIRFSLKLAILLEEAYARRYNLKSDQITN